MAWQSHINQFRDCIQHNDWERAWDAAESMYSELVQAEGMTARGAFIIIAAIASSHDKTQDLIRVARCGPEYWGAPVRRMGATAGKTPKTLNPGDRVKVYGDEHRTELRFVGRVEYVNGDRVGVVTTGLYPTPSEHPIGNVDPYPLADGEPAKEGQ